MPTTPNMNMDLPDVSTTAGPEWASDLNTALTNKVDVHDHTTGLGVKIPSSGLNINADLEMNNQLLAEAKAVELENQAALFTGGSELNRIYGSNAAGGRTELYYRDSSGSNVKLTNNGAINVAGAGGFGGDYVGAGASATFTNATNTYTFNNGSSSRSNIDIRGIKSIGSIKLNTSALAGNLSLSDTDDNFIILVDCTAARTITLPDPTLSKRVICIKVASGSAAANPITVARFASENIEGVAASYLLRGEKGVWWFVSDATNWWIINHVRQADKAKYRGALNSTETVPTSFGSLTINATIVQKGVFLRSSNAIAIRDSGYYTAKLTLGRLSTVTAAKQVLGRVRNTSAGTTKDVATASSVTIGADGSEQTSTFDFAFEVTEAEAGNNFEFQVVATAGGVSVNSAATTDGVDSATFTLSMEREPGLY